MAASPAASLGTSGCVTGLSGGTAVITYTAAGCSVTKGITVNPYPSVAAVTGSSTVCVGSAVTLADATPGGAWSASNARATVSGGVVTGVTAGIDSINYTVTNGCGSTTKSKTITVIALPTAGIITSPVGNLCLGTHATLSETVPGGTWSSATTTIATITPSTGIVTGTGLGYDSVHYTVSNSCGSSVAGSVVPVLAAPSAITGLSNVCTGATDSLFNTTTGGTWTSSTPGKVSIDAASGVATGTGTTVDTVTVTYSTSCGTPATFVVTVYPLPYAGSISGTDSTLCAASTLTLSETVTGGTWSCSNASAGVSGGIVTGTSGGIDTVVYTMNTPYCGFAIATWAITVNALPSAGILVGPDSVCIGTSITLSPTAAGGTWASGTPSVATVSGGLVTGVSVGIDTIAYTVTTPTCGSATVTATVNVGTVPVAGTITGLGNVCTGSVITLSDGVAGGTWGSSATANSTVSGGVVTGVTAGLDTIAYTVTNSCGSTIATKAITINTLPNHGTITGADSVCIGATVTLSETVAGGAWAISNTGATMAAGAVTGAAAGRDTVLYAVTNMCGTTTATLPMYVKPLADAGTITGFVASFCAGSGTTLTDAASGGTWASYSAGSVTSVDAGGVVTAGAASAGPDTISYTVTNTCNTAQTTYAVYVDSVLHPSISGRSYVCLGARSAVDTLSGLPAGGTWSLSNFNASLNNDTLTGLSAGVDTVTYQMSNSCGMFTATDSIWVHSAHECDSILQVATVVGDGGAIKVYPNPSMGEFTVELPAPAQLTVISVIDIYGKVIETREIKGGAQTKIGFNLDNLASGTYMIRVDADNKLFRGKVVVMNR